MNKKLFNFATLFALFLCGVFGYLNIYTNLLCHLKGKGEIGVSELLAIVIVGAILLTLTLYIAHEITEKMKKIFFDFKSEDQKLLSNQYVNLKKWSAAVLFCSMLMAYIAYYNIINWPSAFGVRWWPTLGVLMVLALIFLWAMSIYTIVKLRKVLKKPALYL